MGSIPFDVYRSGGVGMRIFLPMFGLLGLDYGWRFDDVPIGTQHGARAVPLFLGHEHR